VTTKLDHFKPVFADYRIGTLTVHEIIYLMLDVEPRLASDYVVRDADNPSSPTGVPPDITRLQRVLVSAINAAELQAVEVGTRQPLEIEVLRSSLVPWLMENGYSALAQSLSGGGIAPPSGDERLLDQLRKSGGETRRAKNTRSGWTFTGFSKLIHELKAAGQAPSEKTIRSRLSKAADAEEARRREGGKTSDGESTASRFLTSLREDRDRSSS